jgi:hypothetical protein
VRLVALILPLFVAVPLLFGQESDKNAERNREAQESSSRDGSIDISPPKDDAKKHPYSKAAVADSEADASDKPENSDVQEVRPWNPMKAMKDVEVGDF